MPLYLDLAEPQATPKELIPLMIAFIDGEAAWIAKFSQHSNHYEDVDNLKAWAWDLGWRERAWLLTRAEELADSSRDKRRAVKT